MKHHNTDSRAIKIAATFAKTAFAVWVSVGTELALSLPGGATLQPLALFPTAAAYYRNNFLTFISALKP